MKDSEYQKRQEGNATVFEVTPAPRPPKSKFAAFFGVIMLLLGLCMIGNSTIVMFIFFGLGALAIYRGWFRDPRPKWCRSKVTIRVTPSAIETNGRTFNKEDIARLIVKSCAYENGDLYRLPKEHRRDYFGELARAVDLEAGGKAYTLAGGMDSTTAYGLMTDVGKVIGLTHDIR